MKPLYIFLMMWAVFITALSDGISIALGWIPGLGLVLALAITFCINITMGVGLLFVLIANKMFHPKFGPFGVVLGLTPPFNFLPIWVGLVAAGIVHKMSEERSLVGNIAGVVDNMQSGGTQLTKARTAMKTATAMRDIQTQKQQVQTVDYNEPKETEEKTSRSPLPNLKSPTIAPINADITPARPVNQNQRYAQAA